MLITLFDTNLRMTSMTRRVLFCVFNESSLATMENIKYKFSKYSNVWVYCDGVCFFFRTPKTK